MLYNKCVCVCVCVCVDERGWERAFTCPLCVCVCVCIRTCCHFLHILPLIWIHALQAYHDFVHLYMCVVSMCVCMRDSQRERERGGWMHGCCWEEWGERCGRIGGKKERACVIFLAPWPHIHVCLIKCMCACVCVCVRGHVWISVSSVLLRGR